MASILAPESNAWSLSTSSTECEIRTNRTMSLDRAITAYKTERQQHSSCSELVDICGMGDVGIKITPRPAQSGWITRQHKKNRSSTPSMPPPPMQPGPLQKKQHHHRLQQLHKQQQQLLHLRQQLQQQQQQIASINRRGHALLVREVKGVEAIKTGYQHEQPAPRGTFQKLPPAPEPPLSEEICRGSSHHRLPLLDELVSLAPQQDVSYPDVSYPVSKDQTPRECPDQQVEEELLLGSGVKNRPAAADGTVADDAPQAADDAYAAEDNTIDGAGGPGATVFSRHPDWPTVRKVTPRNKGNIVGDADRRRNSGGDCDSPRKKKVSFRFVLEVYLIPRVKDYSKSETKDIWWSREELMEMKRAGQAQQATLSRMSAGGRVGSDRHRVPRVQRRVMRTLQHHTDSSSAASPRRLAYAPPMYTSSYCGGVLPRNIGYDA